jgi:hypothetical protein
MKKLYKLSGVILIGAMLATVAVLAGCDNPTNGNNNNSNNNNNNGGSGGLSGNWGGSVQGQYVLVNITSTGWNLSAPGFSDYGTYSMSGITARLYSTKYNLQTGTAVLLDSDTISVTLNSNSISPGTHTLSRQ